MDTLKGLGLVINAYDQCFSNKTSDGKQCKICWYIDDKKMSQVDPKVNTILTKDIAKQIGYLVITRGKKYTFLGMYIEILDNKNIAIVMKSYIQEAIGFFDEGVSTKLSSPGNKIYTRLIQTPLHYQRIRQNICIPLLKIFYGQLNKNDQIFKL